MRTFSVSLFLVIVSQLLLAGASFAFECKVCHSKNPAMVRMHRQLQGRDCFACHRIGEKLMGKGIPRDLESQLNRRVAEPLCTGCHKGPGGSVVSS